MRKTKLSSLKVVAAQRHKSPLMRLMGAKELTQEDVAECLNVTSRTVSNWVTGKTIPCFNLTDWHKLAKLLGTTIDKLPSNFAPNDQ